jgi:hypothetical protein
MRLAAIRAGQGANDHRSLARFVWQELMGGSTIYRWLPLVAPPSWRLNAGLPVRWPGGRTRALAQRWPPGRRRYKEQVSLASTSCLVELAGWNRLPFARFRRMMKCASFASLCSATVSAFLPERCSRGSRARPAPHPAPPAPPGTAVQAVGRCLYRQPPCWRGRGRERQALWLEKVAGRKAETAALRMASARIQPDNV